MSGILQSVLTCPRCGHASLETMPTDACRFYHDCAHCGALLRPLPGHCCVFCSYGSVPCPPMQAQRGCCGDAVSGRAAP
jgi:hypothetical protein